MGIKTSSGAYNTSVHQSIRLGPGVGSAGRQNVKLRGSDSDWSRAACGEVPVEPIRSRAVQ